MNYSAIYIRRVKDTRTVFFSLKRVYPLYPYQVVVCLICEVWLYTPRPPLILPCFYAIHLLLYFYFSTLFLPFLTRVAFHLVAKAAAVLARH